MSTRSTRSVQARRASRRPAAALAASVLVLSPVLASCGFDAATNRVNTISAGANDRDGDVDVLGAVVIAAEPNRGVFAATLANNSLSSADTLTDLGGDLTIASTASESGGGATDTPGDTPSSTPSTPSDTTSPDPENDEGVTEESTPLVTDLGQVNAPVDPGSRVNMFDEGGIPVTGTFDIGSYVDVTVSFESGQETTFSVPVVKPCDQYSPEKLTSITVPGYVPEDETDSDLTEDGSTEPPAYACDLDEPSTVEGLGGDVGEN